MHNANIAARSSLYLLWAWVFFYNGLDLSENMQIFLDCFILADIVTWLIYQVFLVPRMLIHFGIGTLINLAVIAALVNNVEKLIPSSVDMQAMAIMVFFSVAGVKGFYYFMIEMAGAGFRRINNQ
jgi:hypothetical protein